MIKLTVELKPCPFCGEIPELRKTESGYLSKREVSYNKYSIKCPKCNCRIGYFEPSVYYTYEPTVGFSYDTSELETAIERWNQRDGGF